MLSDLRQRVALIFSALPEVGPFVLAGGAARSDRRPPRDPITTVCYDHRRANFDKYAAYVVVAFVAGG